MQDILQTSYRIQVARSEKELKSETNLIWIPGTFPVTSRY